MFARSPDPTPADELEQLAAQVRRLRPDGRNPEPFYELRSEIAGALMRLSRRLSGRSMPAPMPLRITPPLRPRWTPPAPPPPQLPAPPPLTPPCAALAPRRGRSTRRHRYPRPPVHPGQLKLL